MSQDQVSELYNQGRGLIQRAYYHHVRGYAESILGDVLDGTLEDSDSLEERIREDAESGVTYYWQAYMTLLGTQNEDSWGDLYSSLADLAEAGRGGADSVSSLVTLVAYCALDVDIREDMERLVSVGDYQDKVPDGFDLWDAGTWKGESED